MNPNYASVGRRWVASFVDGIIVSIPSMIIGFVVGASAAVSKDTNAISIASFLAQAISWILSVAYYIYFIGSKGQTLGKMAMGIKVIKKSDGSAPGYMSAFLREVVGKFLSALVLGLGFFWAIWDKEKQTWHDKIANTVVIKL